MATWAATSLLTAFWSKMGLRALTVRVLRPSLSSGPTSRSVSRLRLASAVGSWPVSWMFAVEMALRVRLALLPLAAP